jgi:zinc D-Ala-D-Ala carboxypeptidase
MSNEFVIDEFIYSRTAETNNINNSPKDIHIENMNILFNNVLKPIIDEWGRIRITSGYRNSELNSLVGGVHNSQHMMGEAADFYLPGKDKLKVASWINNNLKYDQLIVEGTYIHISYSKKNRNIFLIADKNGVLTQQPK